MEAQLIISLHPAGMRNLGNSCYINSVMQVLFTVPSFVERFYDARQTILENYQGSNPSEDFSIQMCKLAAGLLSGRYVIWCFEYCMSFETPDISCHILYICTSTVVCL